MVVLVLLRRFEMAITDLPLLEIVVETALIARHCARVDFHRKRGQGAQKVAVVRNEHKRTIIRLQKLLKPIDGGQVEVVGWLIEKKQVRSRGKNPRKFRPHTPAARKTHKGLLKIFRRKAESAKRNLDPRLNVVATEVLKLRLQFPIPLQLRGVSNIRLECGHFRFHLRKSWNAAHGIVE